MLRGMNKAQTKIVNLIMQNDTLSQWDDRNWQDLPEGFLNITSGQIDYNLSEDENFADILSIVKVYIKTTASGIGYEELPKAGKNYTDPTQTGIPSSYRISGRSIMFDVVPNYTSTNGLRVQFIRMPQEISVSDTTKEVGIPSNFHHLLALMTAYDYARAKRMDNRNDILNEINEEMASLGLFVGRQENNSNTVMSAEEICAI